MASSDTKMFTVDKFLGLNESADGETELKMGEASRMKNFFVTDAFNLMLRPGAQRVDFDQERTPAPILGSWSGYIGATEYLLLCDFLNGQDRLCLYAVENGKYVLTCDQSGALGLTSRESPLLKIFSFAGKLYVMSRNKTVSYQGTSFAEETAYIPLVISGATPSGGGTSLENLNLLSAYRRVEYSADGTSTVYALPEEAVSVSKVLVDNVDVSGTGSFSASSHNYTFSTAPAKGVANVEITYAIDSATAEKNRLQILSCPLVEAYNGATDTRIFVAGDGTNICYYSGVTQDGTPSPLYFPAMNEVAVDISSSPITGLVRHYSKLLVFKPDGTFTITYEAVTLTDGSTVAGFYLRSANRELGNAVLGQVQTVNNYPRTLTKNGVYEWRITTSFYQDERYATRISGRVEESLRKADIQKIVTCDDSFQKTYYLFLNDTEGTVLVNRYDLNRDGVWFTYTGAIFRKVQAAFVCGGKMVFVGEKEAFYLEDSISVDTPVTSGEASTAIPAVWESGFMAFGADFRRKYSSYIYVSLLPENNSELIVTASTDRRDAYTKKTVQSDSFSFEDFNFSTFTFAIGDSPKIQRVRLKVKKFVYYKLIFQVEDFGARATVLGFDQQVRFSSMVK